MCESFTYRVKILQKKAWNYQKNPYCYSMFKINDIVINQRGNVGEVVSVTSKGCKLLFKVDFGRVQRFFEAKELTLSNGDLSIEKTLKKS